MHTDIIAKEIRDGDYRCKQCLSTFIIKDTVSNAARRIYKLICSNELCKTKHELTREINTEIRLKEVK